MPKRSAGLLLFRSGSAGTEVLLVHPGGPFWAKKDFGAWSIPKGEIDGGEDPADAALREFAEETGARLPERGLIALGEIQQRSGKVVLAFAAAGDFDPATLLSNLVEIAWPPRSGRTMTIPEVDRAAWFSLGEAKDRILAAQIPFLDRLAVHLGP